jgi:tol-pal system protein YbgF
LVFNTMKFAIVRSFACSLTFVCALAFAASGANAQNWFGQQRNTDEASDLTVRIQKLEAQIRDLTGQNEELQHQNNLLQQQLSARGGGAPQGAPSAPRAQGGPYPAPAGGPMASPGMTQGSMTNPPLAGAPQGAPYGDQRYGGPPPAQPPYGRPQYDDVPAEQAGYGQQPYGGQPQPQPQYGGPAPAPARAGRNDAFDPNTHPNAPGAPRQLGAPQDMGAIAGRPQTAPAPTPQQEQMAVLPPSSSPKDEYDLAYGYLLRRDYALADQAFRVFLQSHPDDRLVPDAHYWLGESLYQRQQFSDAAQTFLDVYNKYPKSAKAPEALLRLGQSLAATGQQEAACASLDAVLKKYPKATPSVKNQVSAEQKRTRC